MGRVDDANRHLDQLNRLYLSTVEALAMAIDAKDQITHGHIRRVQLYAVGLARILGVKDEQLVKAVEAAALLHDTGKLAVPEYILNKPGKLTPAEFEKMKLHATVGADILSSVDFPFPVVPIVRHHHESWDGSGYPAGLRGTDIPIGARILSVVDCFDALTSDRPYRPRLSDDDAIRILLERRGTMYDPLVVDTFIRVHADIAPAVGAPTAPTHRKGLAEIARVSSAALAAAPAQSRRLDDITASTDEMLTLFDLATSLAGQTTLSDAADVIAKHLRRLVPASLCVFYLYDRERDELVAAHASGESESAVRGMRVPLGERLSGWVAAHRQSILNSDPVLDLGDVARSARPRLRSCLGTPLLAGDQLVGVLTLYATAPDGFSEDHRRIIEAVSRQISETVHRATEFETSRAATLKDPLTGLPNLVRLRQFAAAHGQLGQGQPASLVFMDVDGFRRINESYGREAGNLVLAHVAAVVRRILRGADILFRYGGDEFVALLSETGEDAAVAIGARVATSLEAETLELTGGHRVNVSVALGVSTAPADGTTLTDLIVVARQRLSPPRTSDAPNPSAARIH
ncbi:MAG TPA: HD domain-containing phosphohydrolase, partial [Vicinamibacterales bacterium]|nr:HD domain-containing phosphohydrolase [Vicinamibacterales bacterium]